MSKTLQWIGKNLSLGGLVRHTGSGLGTLTNMTAKGVGAVASHIATDPGTKQRIKITCLNVGKSVDSALTTGGAAAGDGINYGVRKVSEAAGHASGGIAKQMGASDENVLLAQKLGTVGGAVMVGMVVGAGVADVAVALGAAAGTAGAAATTSGFASLGGGAIAAGGGGMALGHTIAEGIAAAGGLSGAATLEKDGKLRHREAQFGPTGLRPVQLASTAQMPPPNTATGSKGASVIWLPIVILVVLYACIFAMNIPGAAPSPRAPAPAAPRAAVQTKTQSQRAKPLHATKVRAAHADSTPTIANEEPLEFKDCLKLTSDEALMKCAETAR
jgi:hypothetical protein